MRLLGRPEERRDQVVQRRLRPVMPGRRPRCGACVRAGSGPRSSGANSVAGGKRSSAAATSAIRQARVAVRLVCGSGVASVAASAILVAMTGNGRHQQHDQRSRHGELATGARGTTHPSPAALREPGERHGRQGDHQGHRAPHQQRGQERRREDQQVLEPQATQLPGWRGATARPAPRCIARPCAATGIQASAGKRQPGWPSSTWSYQNSRTSGSSARNGPLVHCGADQEVERAAAAATTPAARAAPGRARRLQTGHAADAERRQRDRTEVGWRDRVAMRGQVGEPACAEERQRERTGERGEVGDERRAGLAVGQPAQREHAAECDRERQDFERDRQAERPAPRPRAPPRAPAVRKQARPWPRSRLAICQPWWSILSGATWLSSSGEMPRHRQASVTPSGRRRARARRCARRRARSCPASAAAATTIATDSAAVLPEQRGQRGDHQRQRRRRPAATSASACLAAGRCDTGASRTSPARPAGRAPGSSRRMSSGSWNLRAGDVAACRPAAAPPRSPPRPAPSARAGSARPRARRAPRSLRACRRGTRCGCAAPRSPRSSARSPPAWRRAGRGPRHDPPSRSRP